MVKAENLILEGKYFVAGNSDVDYANKIKQLITRVMNSRGYDCKNEINPFNHSKFLSIVFDRDLPEISSHYKERFQKGIGIINEQALAWKKYQKSLNKRIL
jgi:hypothetical protein